MSAEIKSTKGDLPQAHSDLDGVWEDIVKRANLYHELVDALMALEELDKLDHLSDEWWAQAQKSDELRRSVLAKVLHTPSPE